MYAIEVSVAYPKDQDGFTKVNHWPIFYMDNKVQGIINEIHAEKIVRKMLEPLNSDVVLYIYVTKSIGE